MQMNDSGDQVFGDNIDKILSDKIIEHTEMSEKDTENSSQNNKQKSKSTVIIISLVLLIASVLIFTAKKSYSSFFDKK